MEFERLMTRLRDVEANGELLRQRLIEANGELEAWRSRYGWLTDGKEPCGECHIQPGETCDICGASHAAVDGEHELAETVHGEIVRIVKRRSLKEPLETSTMSTITISRQSTPDELAAEMDRRGDVIISLEAKLKTYLDALESIDAVGVDFGHFESAARTMQEIARKAVQS